MFDARPVATRRRFPAWFLALGLLLGLNLLVLLYVLLREDRAAAPASAAPMPAAASAPVVMPPAPQPAQASPPSPQPTTSGAPPAATARPAATVATAASAPTAATAPASTPASGRASGSMSGPAPVAAMPARTRDDLLAAGDAVPEAQVSLHVYDADPAKRFVFLNGQRLREGDAAANGLRVERIDADGVVLDHRGNDFKVALEP